MSSPKKKQEVPTPPPVPPLPPQETSGAVSNPSNEGNDIYRSVKPRIRSFVAHDDADEFQRPPSVNSILSTDELNPAPEKLEPANVLLIRIESWGYEDSRRLGSIRVNGEVLANFSDKQENFRGLHIVTFKKEGSSYKYDQYLSFDVWKGISNSESFNTYIKSLPKGTVVLGGSADEIHKNIKFAEEALTLLDLELSDFSYRGAISFATRVGYSGIKQKSERHKGPVLLKTVMNLTNDQSDTVRPTLSGVITPNDLQKQARILKASKKSVTTHVDKTKLFLEGDSESFFPLKRIKTMFDVPFDYTVAHVDFTGIEQLTDLVFYAFAHLQRLAKALSQVRHVALSGCFHITDQGIKWMSEGLPGLESIAAQGCKSLTEKSIYYCLKNCKNIETFNLVGCSVGNVYLPTTFNLGALKLKGCPVVTSKAFHNMVHESSSVVARNDYFEALRKESPLKVYRAVIIKSSDPDLAKVSVLNILNRKPQESKNMLGHLYNLKVPSTDLTFNITECTQELADLYFSERTLYFLPYNPDSPPHESKYDIVNRITHVLAQVPTACFAVIPVKIDTNKDDSAKPENDNLIDRETICHALDKRVKHYVKGNGKYFMRVLDTQAKDITFQQQVTLGQGIALSYNLADIIDNPNRILVSSTNVSSADWRKDFFTKLENGAGEIDRRHPWFNKFSKEFKDLIKQCSFKEKIMTERDFVKKLKDMNGSELSDQDASYLRAAEYLHMLGIIVHAKQQPYSSGPEGTGIIVTDPGWLIQVMNKLLLDSASQMQGKYSVVTKKTPTWSKAELAKVLMDESSDEQVNCWTDFFKNTSLWMEIDEQNGIFTPQIDENAPIDKHHYFSDSFQKSPENQDIFDILKCQYKVFQPLPESFFIKLAGNPVMSYTAVWKYGLITTNIPVESLIIWENVDSSEYLPAVSIICQKPKPKEGAAKNIEYAWTEMDKLTTLVEAYFKQYGFAFTKQIEYEKTIVEKPDSVKGIVSQCFPFKNLDTCSTCQTSLKQSQLFWQMDHYLKPTFCGEIPNLRIADPYDKGKFIRGNWISSSKRERIKLSTVMQPVDNCTVELTLKNGNFEQFGIENNTEAVVVDVAKCCVEHETKSLQTKILCSVEPESGCTISISLFRDKNMKVYVKVLMNSVTLCIVEMQNNSYSFDPFIQTESMCGIFTNVSKSSTISAKASGLQAGMRLEAFDKISNDRICVATVDKVDRDTGQIVIHFDGWTNRYDYITTMDDPLIHPVGYFYQRAVQSARYKRKLPRGLLDLQPPKSMLAETKTFSWDKYLKDIAQWPVPYSLFTEEQTEGCTPFELSPSTMNVLMKENPADLHACLSQMHNRPNVMQKNLKNLMVKGVKLYEHSLSSSRNLPILCLMPRLTKEKVAHPSMQSFFNQDKESSSEALLLCPYQYNHHFMNVSSELGKKKSSSAIKKMNEDKKTEKSNKLSVKADDVKSISSYLFAVSSKLVQQKYLFPNNIEKVFPELTSLSQYELDAGIKQILSYQLMYLSLYAGNSLPSAIPEAEIEAVRKITSVDANKDYNDMLCQAHHTAINFAKLGYDTFETKVFKDYSNLITRLYIGITDGDETSTDRPKLTSLPDDFFLTFPNITHLVLKGHNITRLPPNLEICTQLELLDVSENPLTDLDGIEQVKDTLTALDFSHTNIVNIPDNVYKCVHLRELRADKIEVHKLSAEIGELVALRILSLSENCLEDIPKELGNCKELIELDLSGLKWSNKTTLGYHNFSDMLNYHPYTAKLDEKTRRKYFTSSDQKVFLNESEVGKLNLFLFKEFPRLKATEDGKAQFLDTIVQLQKLEFLNLSYQGLRVVPSEFQHLSNLATLDVSHNPLLESVAAEISVIPNLSSLELKGNPSLKTPPREIVSRGFKAVYGYLRRLLTGSVECKRTKLMMVGLGGAGKTSLVSTFTRRRNPGHYGDYGHDESEEITDGIDIVDWNVKTKEGSTLTYSIWDFAGQSVYYNTHQFFLSNRAVYLLIWNIRLGYEHAGLDFWLSSIACHAPKAPVIVVGTHRDQVDKFWLPEEEMRKKYSQIRSFHAISVFKNIGVNALVQDLLEITLQEKYMGEKIPEAWLNFEKKMTEKKNEVSLLMWKEVEELAEHAGLMDKLELHQAVGFLHDLGSVQHFKNMFLRSRVVINPQWIVDAMACVVSVHETPIVDGNFLHKDVKIVWKNYPQELHHWLLRLTEEFDLTFPLPDQKVNIVPCLLPPDPPEFKWLNIEDNPGYRETKMLYKFEYLPAGLFNRAQVRLYQFCDSSVIWKKGSKLMKNGHHALMEQINGKVVIVKAQGYRPENVLFLVHEVFESLIAESFHGVTYDFFIPCGDCLKVDCYDPCMFAASKVTRALELKAPFLQCDKYFHNISLIEIQAIMPPSSNSDFDIHLEKSVRDLEDIQSDLVTDVFMVYCAEDIPQIGEEDKRIHPRKIYEDLKTNGFKVWFPIDPANINLQLVSVTMRDAKLVLICISDHFVANQMMCDMFHYAKTNLQKNIQLVVLGSTLNWKNSTTGLLVTDDVFVNMMQPGRYQHKIKELVEKVKQKMNTVSVMKQPANFYPKCFISYCWTNSADAIKKGSKPQRGSVGWGDPRELKNLLEENGISCWLDVEKMGQGGLFEEIADGLKNAKVMVACVSDEYAKSKNCQLEFRFASITLKIPMVVAVVGTGQKWEATEVGMLALGSPKVMFQYESPSAHQRLVNAVQNAMPIEQENDEGYESRTPSADDNNHAAFQELLELAQRKFLRQVANIAENKGYPRLFVLDFLTKEEKENHANDKMMDHNLKENDKIPALPEESEDKENIPLNQNEGGNKEQMNKNVTGSLVSLRPRSALRKKTSGLTAVSASLAIAQLAKEKIAKENLIYCARFLCEHEQGWHCHGQYIPINIEPNELEETFDLMAPYMARILAILKYAGVDLEILNTEKGEKLRKELEDKCGTEPEFGKEYEEMRSFVMKLDAEKHMGDLARCQLPSGKIVWLCPSHHESDRITVLGVEDGLEDIADPDDDTITASMLEELNHPEQPKDKEKSPQRPTPRPRKKSDLAASSLKTQGKQVNAAEAAKVAGGISQGNNKSKACNLM